MYSTFMIEDALGILLLIHYDYLLLKGQVLLVHLILELARLLSALELGL